MMGSKICPFLLVESDGFGVPIVLQNKDQLASKPFWDGQKWTVGGWTVMLTTKCGFCWVSKCLKKYGYCLKI